MTARSDLWLFAAFIIVFCFLTSEARHKRQDLSFPTSGTNRATETSCTVRRGSGGSGVCRPLSACPSVSAAISSAPRRTAAQQLRQYLCRYDRGTPIVCCPQPAVERPSTPVEEPFGTRVVNNRQVAAGSCGVRDEINTRILNGRIAGQNAWPWAAAIYDEQFNQVFFRCGGTLINENHILTAAHCVTDRLGIIPANKFTVRMGLTNLASGTAGSRPVQMSVSRIIVHPRYNIRRAQPELDDIALLRLSGPVRFDAGLKPICLPTANMARQTLAGTLPFVIGWGKTETGKYSDDLMEVQIPVQDTARCRSAYPGIPIGPTHLCAGYPQGGKDSCQGDSGGPMMLQDPSNSSPTSPWSIVGIVSMGPECGKAGLPAIYTRVDSYLDWIRTNAV